MKAIRTMGLLVVIAAAFTGGYIYKAVKGSASGEKSGRKILYWVDPMHPAYKSDKPGIAPDCGMTLEPVYESGTVPNPAVSNDPQPAGTVQVSVEKQQLIGVKYAVVEAA